MCMETAESAKRGRSGTCPFFALRLPEALHSKTSGTFDPIRSGRLPPSSFPALTQADFILRSFFDKLKGQV